MKSTLESCAPTTDAAPARRIRATASLRPAHVLVCAALVAVVGVAGSAAAATPKTAAKPSAKPSPKKGAAAAKAAPALVLPEASAEQIDAAERVYYGVYECEFKQSVAITASAKHPSYVEVKHGKSGYLMKPVLSSTGAVRLEDVHGETLMVQIMAKSMLLNVKTGHREVDECISPKQRELLEAARVAKAEAAAAAAAPGASAASAAAPAAPLLSNEAASPVAAPSAPARARNPATPDAADTPASAASR
jgi:hypothetical protein